MSEIFHDRLKILEPEWTSVLQRNLFGLCKHIEPDNGLIDFLLSSGVLNKKAAESFRVKMTKYCRNQAILEFIQRRPYKDFVKFSEALRETEQEHIVDSFFYAGGIVALMDARRVAGVQDCRTGDEDDAVPDVKRSQSFDWRYHIKKYLTCLNEAIDPDHGLIPALAHKQVIQEWIMDKYLKPEGRNARVQQILLELILKSDKHFDLFCDSLEETNQIHIVTDYLHPNSTKCYRHSFHRSFTCTAIGADGDQIAQNWKTLLMKNRSNLTEKITPSEDLVNHLEYSGVMNKQCAEQCKEISPEYRRTEFILNYLQTRPDKDFVVFCKALELSDQKHVIETYLQEEHLSPSVQESRSAPATPVSHLRLGGDNDRNCECTPQEENCQAEHLRIENLPEPRQDTNSIHGGLGECLSGDQTAAIQCTSYEQTAQAVQNVDPQFTERAESHLLDSGFDSNTPSEQLDLNRAEHPDIPVVGDDSIYQERPTPIQDVRVRRSEQQFCNQNLHTSYAMSRNVRGRCIIFNNHKFIRMRDRSGTTVDGELLCKLFKELSFSVEEIKDAPSETIKSKLRDISEDESLENDECLAVFILSHGDCRNEKCVIYGSDENFFMLDEILDLFAPNNCPQMRGKPKLVFVQACRGEQYDSTDSAFDGENEERPVTNSYPDFLIGFPTQAGYRAFRDIDHGSWYINALTRVFMAKAHNTSLNSMMNQVAGIASRWLSQTGAPRTDNKTQYAIYTCSFTKDLFFFPGIIG